MCKLLCLVSERKGIEHGFHKMLFITATTILWFEEDYTSHENLYTIPDSHSIPPPSVPRCTSVMPLYDIPITEVNKVMFGSSERLKQ